ncbi:MAG: response regulator transcription factor, partial [Burkholderiales bacterium]
IVLAERLPAGHQLAKAWATESYLRMLNRDYHDAIVWGEKAIELAKRFEHREILASAYNSVGAALLFVDYPRGCDYVRKSLEIAKDLGDGAAAVADAYVMLGSGSGEVYEFSTADRYLVEGIAFARAHDLDRLAGYMEGWQALCDVYQGRWNIAGERANAVAKREAGGTTNRVTALIALGRLRTRRGDPGAMDVLDEALDLAMRSGTLQRLAPVCGARAEAAWIDRLDRQTKSEAERAFDLAAKKGHPWFLGELAFWLWRVGELHKAPPASAEPYRLQIDGRWQEAAVAWQKIGCPYEQARALADGDETAQRASLSILDRLGARPLADRVRQQMRSAGIRSIPRGPLPPTRDNAAGLTTRELQVLALVADGWRNAQIAAHLSRSPKTIDHHLESILAKLGVATRGEAAATALRLGLLSKNG